MGASASSSVSPVHGAFPASRLIDGLGINGSCYRENGLAHTFDDATNWFSLDLEIPKRITRVQIANRLDCCFDRGQNVRISIGPSRVYAANEPLCLPEIPQLNQQPGLQDYVCTGDLHVGRFVKISRAGWLNLCEVKVFTTLQGKRGSC